jgi:hypothetical protein
MKTSFLLTCFLFAQVAAGQGQSEYVHPMSPPVATVVKDADHPGPRDPAAEQEIRNLIERYRLVGLNPAQEPADIEFMDKVLLAADHIEINAYGAFSRRVAGSSVRRTNLKSERFDAVNVIVFGDVAAATYRETRELAEPLSTGLSTAYFRIWKIFQKRDDRWKQLANLWVQESPVPGPDPWGRIGYWQSRLTSVPAPPVAGLNDGQHPGPRDTASERAIVALLERSFESVAPSRTIAESRADDEFLASITAAQRVTIGDNGKFQRIEATATQGATVAAKGRRFGVNVMVWGDLALAVHQGPVRDSIYGLYLNVFRQRDGRWQRFLFSPKPLFPQPGPDPWGWMKANH